MEDSAHTEQLGRILVDRRNLEFEGTGHGNRKCVRFQHERLDLTGNMELAVVFQINEILLIVVSIVCDLPFLIYYNALDCDIFRYLNAVVRECLPQFFGDFMGIV